MRSGPTVWRMAPLQRLLQWEQVLSEQRTSEAASETRRCENEVRRWECDLDAVVTARQRLASEATLDAGAYRHGDRVFGHAMQGRYRALEVLDEASVTLSKAVQDRFRIVDKLRVLERRQDAASEAQRRVVERRQEHVHDENWLSRGRGRGAQP